MQDHWFFHLLHLFESLWAHVQAQCTCGGFRLLIRWVLLMCPGLNLVHLLARGPCYILNVDCRKFLSTALLYKPLLYFMSGHIHSESCLMNGHIVLVNSSTCMTIIIRAVFLYTYTSTNVFPFFGRAILITKFILPKPGQVSEMSSWVQTIWKHHGSFIGDIWLGWVFGGCTYSIYCSRGFGWREHV